MKTQQRTFGLSVLTHHQAAILKPVAQKQTKLNAVRHAMEEKGVDPTIAQNVLQWQRKRQGRTF